MSKGNSTGELDTLIAGRYRIGPLLGRGMTASVYQARDESLGRDTALKLFLPQVEGDAEHRRFEAEMRLVATFNHPALVTLYDAGIDTRIPDEPRTFLVMELSHGPTLYTRLQQGPLSGSHVAGIGADLASALDYVHGRGVIHRDIKPANILLSDNRSAVAPRPKLTDFGIARIIEGTRLTATGTTIGTAAYLSPEQARGSTLGPESDIYSMGLVLLECLTGILEYPGTSVESAVARLHRLPRVPANLGPGWVALLSAMTAAEPADRPAAQDIEAVLRAATESGEPEVLAPSNVEDTMAFPSLPERPPRQHVLIPALPSEDNERTASTTRPITLGQSRQRVLRLLPRFAWVGGAGLALAILLVLVVSGLNAAQVPTPSVPEPLPSISGPLGVHIEELQRSITP